MLYFLSVNVFVNGCFVLFLFCCYFKSLFIFGKITGIVTRNRQPCVIYTAVFKNVFLEKDVRYIDTFV